MARFLSAEWIDRLAEEAARSPALAEVARGLDVEVRHVVRDGPEGDAAYTVRLAGGEVSVRPGDGGDADLVVSCDYATAAAVSQGRITPAEAFAAGRLKLGGRVGVVAGHAGLLAGLADVFGPLRATTEY